MFGFQLESRRAEMETACMSYRERIAELWERLQIPQEEREAVAEHMQCSKKRNMDAVRFTHTPLQPLQISLTDYMTNN